MLLEIEEKKELENALANRNNVLLCFFQRGCSMCTEVDPLVACLDSRNLDVIKACCDRSDELLSEYGGEGTPFWCLLRNGEKVKDITPTEDKNELFSFITKDLGVELSKDEFDEAMKAGEEKREFQEAAIAEIMFRSKESDEDSLTYAARLKIMRPCISTETDEELRRCIKRNIEHFSERLRTAMESEGGDTMARRSILEKLPDMEEDMIREIIEIKN